MKSPRIGCVKYLNARPLIRGWVGDAHFDHPSALCNKLARGELDIALASSFEFLRNPVYQIVDDVSISSVGPVYSVVVAHTRDISEIKEIELDPASETSGNLLRCLLTELGLKARVIRNIDLQSVRPGGLKPAESKTADSMSAGGTGHSPMLPSSQRARLLIGDQAIRFRQKHAAEFHFWDLGEQWNKLVSLPFVYALWLIRPKVRNSEPLAERLRKLRDENLAGIERLIAEEKEFDHDFCRRYYGEHLGFGFGEKEKEGLQAFAGLCARHRLLPTRDFTFDVV